MPTAQAATLLARAPTPWRDADTNSYVVDLEERGPEFPSHFVRRPALVDRIRSEKAALALLIAPPGYGKTSLLSEWAERDERPFVWLVIDPRHSSGTPEPALSSLTCPPAKQSACVAVLDDAHLLTPAALRAVVERVLGELPPGSVLALASRSELQLPIGRLRAHRAVTELRTQDFAMSPAEAAALLRMAGYALDATVVDELVRRTEGWPAALYLAGMSLRDHDDEGFRGSDHLVSEYLGDEVLSALPDELIAFAQRASVLDELSGELCDSVLEQRRTGRKLALLARSSQLLEPVDAGHDRYRWHPLIRESLTGELHRVEPQLELELHRRASRWFVQHGDIDRAIEHACAARDPRAAGELIWSNILRYVTSGQAAQVIRWLERFADEEIRRDGRLAMCAAHACIATGNLGQAQQWARSAEEAGVEDCSSASLDLIQAMGNRGGADAMRMLAEGVYESEPPASQWRPVALALRGIAEHLVGDRDTATQSLEEATDLAGAALPGLTALCTAQRAMVAIERSDWPIAADLTDAATEAVRQHQLSDDPLMALVFAAAAACRAHEGRSDEAKRDLRAGISLLASFGDSVAWYSAEARVLLAHASLWLADVVGARTLLAQASRVARRTGEAKALESWFDDAWAYMDTLAETSLLGPSALTIAELRILRFLPTHRSFREIGSQLGVSANTVKTQAHAIYRKLGVASRSEAVESAAAAGLLGQ